MIPLTRQEQRVIVIAFLMLLTGLLVKTYRTSRAAAGAVAVPEATTDASSQF